MSLDTFSEKTPIDEFSFKEVTIEETDFKDIDEKTIDILKDLSILS